jgi:hypothetical protein
VHALGVAAEGRLAAGPDGLQVGQAHPEGLGRGALIRLGPAGATQEVGPDAGGAGITGARLADGGVPALLGTQVGGEQARLVRVVPPGAAGEVAHDLGVGAVADFCNDLALFRRQLQVGQVDLAQQREGQGQHDVIGGDLERGALGGVLEGEGVGPRGGARGLDQLRVAADALGPDGRGEGGGEGVVAQVRVPPLVGLAEDQELFFRVKPEQIQHVEHGLLVGFQAELPHERHLQHRVQLGVGGGGHVVLEPGFNGDAIEHLEGRVVVLRRVVGRRKHIGELDGLLEQGLATDPGPVHVVGLAHHHGLLERPAIVELDAELLGQRKHGGVVGVDELAADLEQQVVGEEAPARPHAAAHAVLRLVEGGGDPGLLQAIRAVQARDARPHHRHRGCARRTLVDRGVGARVGPLAPGASHASGPGVGGAFAGVVTARQDGGHHRQRRRGGQTLEQGPPVEQGRLEGRLGLGRRKSL